MNKVRILAIALAMICAGTIPVLAYMYFFETEPTYIASGITLQSYPTPNMTLGVYWDENCTQPVTSFDFGEMIHPTGAITLWKVIYIRNEGNVTNRLNFNSTLPFHYPVGTEVADDWTTQSGAWDQGPNIRNIDVDPDEVLQTFFKVRIPAYATIGAYNWTLAVWGEHTY